MTADAIWRILITTAVLLLAVNMGLQTNNNRKALETDKILFDLIKQK